MDSLNQSTGFRYNPNPNTISSGDSDSEFSEILEIFVHHATNIHNICIYENQDVYAKFSLTYNPDETFSTQIINGGGKNPVFNEKLTINITQHDAVLKCEIWMLSRARNFMEDQLLGFALVPISQVVGKENFTLDHDLSSTDLFHSPAGTVKLSLSLITSLPVSVVNPPTNSSISSAAVPLDPVDYSRIEFPDINVATENQQMVSEYFDGASFLHLGTSTDCEMTINSPNGSNQNSGFLSSTTTSLSDDRNSSADSVPKKNHLGAIAAAQSHDSNPSSGICPDTPNSEQDTEVKGQKGKELENKFCQAFSSPPGNINLEAEQNAMQQQIVDMYMRSMQQFSESLAKMKRPIMELDKPECKDHGDVIQSSSNKIELEKKKREGSRVFYGSRAFF